MGSSKFDPIQSKTFKKNCICIFLISLFKETHNKRSPKKQSKVTIATNIQYFKFRLKNSKIVWVQWGSNPCLPRETSTWSWRLRPLDHTPKHRLEISPVICPDLFSPYFIFAFSEPTRPCERVSNVAYTVFYFKFIFSI